MVGIYKITNKITGQCYIGQSIDISRRWRAHRQMAKEQSCNAPLYIAIREYGIDNFDFEVLAECSHTELNSLEKYYIALYDSYNNGYNQTIGGAGTSNCCVKISTESLVEIYDLLINTDISLGKIAERYNVGIDTISEINTGKTRIQEDYTYPLRKKERFCFCCGKKLKPSQDKYCSVECVNKINRSRRPSREELKNLIRSTPFTTIGKKFGVSDNAIRKWCVAEKLPTKVKEIKLYSDEEWSKI